MTLDELKPNQSAYIKQICLSGRIRQRLLDLGIVSGTSVIFVRSAPMGDPIDIYFRGFELTLRRESAKNIEIERINGNES